MSDDFEVCPIGTLAKLAKYEQAKMPERPHGLDIRSGIVSYDYAVVQEYAIDLETFAAAQTVRAEELQTMFGSARTLCLVNGCPAETFDAAIAEALKEPKT